jgi:hypothetical protein
LVYFSRFGMFGHRTIWQPWKQSWKLKQNFSEHFDLDVRHNERNYSWHFKVYYSEITLRKIPGEFQLSFSESFFSREPARRPCFRVTNTIKVKKGRKGLSLAKDLLFPTFYSRRIFAAFFRLENIFFVANQYLCNPSLRLQQIPFQFETLKSNYVSTESIRTGTSE